MYYYDITNWFYLNNINSSTVNLSTSDNTKIDPIKYDLKYMYDWILHFCLFVYFCYILFTPRIRHCVISANRFHSSMSISSLCDFNTSCVSTQLVMWVFKNTHIHKCLLMVDLFEALLCCFGDFRPCIHRMFPCGVCPCASVTRSDDGGRNSTTSQHTTTPPPVTSNFDMTPWPHWRINYL